MQIAFPFQIDPHGLVASAREDAHIRDLIEQVLFTAPGERVNRPDFGCALLRMVFASADTEQMAALQGIVHGALQQWLRDLIKVERVSVDAEESTLTVFVQYVILQTQQRHSARFVR